MTILPRTLIPPDVKPSPRTDQARMAQWAEIRSLFPIYLAIAKLLEAEVPFSQDMRSLPERPTIAKLLEAEVPFSQDMRSLPERPTNELFEQVCLWLDQTDQQVHVHQLRHLLQMTTLNASEEGMRALILRHLRKPSKSNTDRDKIDFLLVQYFALCAPAKIYHKQIELADVGQVMKSVLGETDTAPLDWCAPLEKMIEALHGFRSLRELLKTNFIEQGRRVKESAGGMFYDASALLAFIRFNFLLRRTLIELMHADLIAIRSGIAQLEAAKERTIDCKQSGLTASEPLPKLRQIADEWKQPFQKEYTERSVSQTFEKLLAMRSDVERALERIRAKSSDAAGAPADARTSARDTASRELATPRPNEQVAAPINPAASTVAPLDFESCMEKIWEQLIAAPPSRGRSMMTISVGNARILMSSWEVAAFISEDGPSAEDLRRAVVARALVTVATESAKDTGNATGLERALTIARVEISRLQERVDVAKQAKDTEAAVNLGISTKRLVSAIDEAEKL